MANGKVRVAGRIVERPSRGDAAAQQRFEKRVKELQQLQKQRKQRKLREARKQKAKEVEQELKNIDFQTVEQAEKSFKKIPEDVKKFVEFSPEKLKQEKLQGVKSFEKDLKDTIKSRKQEIQEIQNRDIDSLEERREQRQDIEQEENAIKRAEERLKVVDEAKKKINQGVLLDPKEVKEIAGERGKAVFRKEEVERKRELAKEKAKEKAKPQKKQVTLEATSPFQRGNFTKKVVKKGGKTRTIFTNRNIGEKFEFAGKKEIQDLDQIFQRGIRAEESSKVLDDLEKVENVKTRDLKNLGFTDKEIDVIQGKKDLESLKEFSKQRKESVKSFRERRQKIEQIQERQKERKARFKESLGSLSKALTEKQIDRLRKRQAVSKFVPEIQADIRRIRDSKKLSPLEKEDALRELMGITSGKPQDQKLFKDKTSLIQGTLTKNKDVKDFSTEFADKVIKGDQTIETFLRNWGKRRATADIDTVAERAKANSVPFIRLKGDLERSILARGAADVIRAGKETAKVADDISKLLQTPTGTSALGTVILPGEKLSEPIKKNLRADQKKSFQNLERLWSPSTFFAMGKAIGKDVESNDPYRNVRGLLGFAEMMSVVRGIPLKQQDKRLEVQNAVTEYDANIKYSPSTLKDRVTKESALINTKTTGLLKDGQSFSQTTKLRYLPQEGKLRGNIRTKLNPGKQNQRVIEFKDIEFEEKEGFFESKDGRFKIPKKNAPVDNIKISIDRKEKKLPEKGQPFSFNAEGNAVLADLKRKRVKEKVERDKKQRIQTRKEIDSAVREKITGEGKVLNAGAIQKTLTNVVGQNKRISTKKNLQDLVNTTKLLESVGYDRQILQGLDRRTRLAGALDLKKKSPIVKTLAQSVDKGYIVQTGKARATGSFQKIEPQKFSIGPTSLLGNKSLKRLAEKDKQGNIKAPQRINLPDTSVDLYIPTRTRIRALIPKNLLDEAVKSGLILSKDKALSQKAQQKGQAKELGQLKTPAKKKAQKTEQVKVSKVKTVQKPKQKQAQKKGVKTPESFNIRIPDVGVTRIFTKSFRIDIDPEKLEKTPTSKQGFRLRLIKNGKTQFATNQPLPRKRANNLARRLIESNRKEFKGIDKYELVQSGNTKVKDVKKQVFPNKYEVEKDTQTLVRYKKKK